MNVLDVPAPLLDAIDSASRGKLGEIRGRCEGEGWAMDVRCVTHLDGLPERQMKLQITATEEGRVMLFIEAPLERAARALGWNLYLAERVAAARRGLASVERHLGCVEARAPDQSASFDFHSRAGQR